MIYKRNSVSVAHFIEYVPLFFVKLFCKKKTIDNTVEKHIIHLMGLHVVFSDI